MEAAGVVELIGTAARTKNERFSREHHQCDGHIERHKLHHALSDPNIASRRCSSPASVALGQGIDNGEVVTMHIGGELHAVTPCTKVRARENVPTPPSTQYRANARDGDDAGAVFVRRGYRQAGCLLSSIYEAPNISPLQRPVYAAGASLLLLLQQHALH